MGNRKSLKAIVGASTLSRDYTYDALGRLTEIEDEKDRKSTYTYDSRSRVLTKVLPNGTKTEFTYDAASELVTLTHKDPSGNSFRTLNYTYDTRGLITQKNDSFEGTSVFAYDKLGELISIMNPVIGLVTFGLDALGNRTQLTNEYSTAGTKSFQYDLNGNLLERLDTATGLKTSYAYDVQNRLTQITLPDGSIVSFTYDVLGRRITKTVNSQTLRYLWDGSELLADLDPQGSLLRSYVHGPVVDEILYQEDYQKNETLFFHQDNLESTMALTDSQGQVKESYSYDPYGNLLTPPSVSSTRFLYTGRELDSETKLYYNRARYYDPSLGRFLSPDPKGYEAGLNLYTYTRNNPLSFRDPDGLDVYWGGGGERGKGGGLKGFFGVLLGIAVGFVLGPVIGAVAGAIGGAVGGAVGGVVGAVGGAVAGAAGSAIGTAVGAAVGAIATTAAVAAGTAVVATAASNIVQGAPVFRGVGTNAAIAAITAGAGRIVSSIGGAIAKGVSTVVSAISSATRAVSSFAIRAFDAVKGAASGIFNTGRGLIQRGWEFFRGNPETVEKVVETGVNTVKLFKGDPSDIINQALNFPIDKWFPNLPDNPVIEFARTGEISPKTVAQYVNEVFRRREESIEITVPDR